MNNTTFNQIIRARFLDIWPDGVPVVFDNEPALEPTGLWARFSVKPGETIRKYIDVRAYETIGNVFLQIFVPQGQGDGEGWALADHFSERFNEWSSADYSVRFNSTSAETVTTADYLMIRVNAKYTATHTVTPII